MMKKLYAALTVALPIFLLARARQKDAVPAANGLTSARMPSVSA